jgi:hypothetical protein
MGKKKNKRGAHLAEAREAKAAKSANFRAATSHTDHVSDAEDDDFQPDEAEQEEPQSPALLSPSELVAEKEPGQMHAAGRVAAARSGGATKIKRLDGDAARQRRCTRRKQELGEMPSIRAAFDGIIHDAKMAKKVAQELEPLDAWVNPPVAMAELVRVDVNGERMVVLGVVGGSEEQPAVTAHSVEASEGPKRVGRPPGGAGETHENLSKRAVRCLHEPLLSRVSMMMRRTGARILMCSAGSKCFLRSSTSFVISASGCCKSPAGAI